MIVDRLENAPLYYGVQPRMRAAFEWLRATDLAALPLGKTQIDGDAMYAIVVEQMLRERKMSVLEAHRAYFDLQFIERGEEHMGWVSLAHATATGPYEEERDVTFFEDKETCFVRVPAGHFAIFGPDDVHMPAVAPEHGPASIVRKIVVKIGIE